MNGMLNKYQRHVNAYHPLQVAQFILAPDSILDAVDDQVQLQALGSHVLERKISCFIELLLAN